MAALTLCVILPAAGHSSRFDASGGRSKLDEDLGGRSVLQRSIELFVNREDVGSIVVAGPYAGYDGFVLRHADRLALLGVTLCRGGESHRWETVRNALEHVPASATHIAVHDAARPCTPLEVIDRVFEAAQKYPGVIPAIDVSDTLKHVSEEATIDEDIDPLDAILGDAGKVNVTTRRVRGTLDRSDVVAAQTPQVFEADLLRAAYAQNDLASTDDAGLVERLGKEVVVVEGDARNIKLTRQADLHLIRAIMGISPPAKRSAHKRF